MMWTCNKDGENYYISKNKEADGKNRLKTPWKQNMVTDA